MTALTLLQLLESPSAIRLDPDFWDVDLVDDALPRMSVEETGRVFGPGYEYSAPAHHPERVQYFDVVQRRSSAQLLGAGVWTIEVVRQSVPVEAVAVIDRIATWFRLTLQPPGGGGGEFELYDGAVAPATAIGSPFPFPFEPIPGSVISARWLLIREGIPDSGGQQPEFVGQFVAGDTVIPADKPVLPGWSDQRYAWGSTPSEGLYFVEGGRALLRLFCTLTIAGAGLWGVSLAGRVGGFFQNPGYLRAGLSAATSRR